jgi:hypothetical protein
MNGFTPLHATDAYFGDDRRVYQPRKLLILKITVRGVEGEYKYNPYPSI